MITGPQPKFYGTRDIVGPGAVAEQTGLARCGSSSARRVKGLVGAVNPAAS
jgi:hypothetical protein